MTTCCNFVTVRSTKGKQPTNKLTMKTLALTLAAVLVLAAGSAYAQRTPRNQLTNPSVPPPPLKPAVSQR